MFDNDSRANGGGHRGGRAINPGLQGLRGVAIGLVLLNHAHVPGFDGGYVGVDIFFVISGFLIGGLLLRELEASGRIDLWAFYARRCRRLLPACAVLLVAVLCAIPWLYAPMEHPELFSSVRASALYAVNLWFGLRRTNYFGGHTEANPLLHLWSLAVEEQFYLFWPLMMLGAFGLAGRAPRKAMTWLVVVAGLASFAACVAVTEVKFQYAFYLTPMRVWEFCAGMGVALLPVGRMSTPRWVIAALGLCGLVGVAGATVLFDGNLRFPGAWAAIPVLASTALLIVVQQEQTNWINTLLCIRPLRWLGDCSYSVYLWHWPLLLFASVLSPRPDALVTSVAVALSLLLGWLSYRGIEQPFTHGRLAGWPARRTVALGTALFATLAIGAHIAGRVRTDFQDARYEDAANWKLTDRTGCLVLFDEVDQPPCEFGSPIPGKTIVLFGDSHASQWFAPLEALARRNAWRLIMLTKANCPAPDIVVEYFVTRAEYWQCTQWRARMFARIEAVRPDLVILASSSGLGIEPGRWREGLIATTRRLAATGANIAYLSDNPFPGFNVPTCIARAAWRGVSHDGLCTYLKSRETARYGPLAQAEAEAMRSAGGTFVDLSPVFCSSSLCPTERDGVIMFKDRNHLSEAFALALQPELDRRLAPLLRGR